MQRGRARELCSLTRAPHLLWAQSRHVPCVCCMNTEKKGGILPSASQCQEDLTIHEGPGSNEGDITHTHARTHTPTHISHTLPIHT